MRDLKEESEEGGWQLFTLLLPMLLVSGYLTLFARVQRRISRTRELRADAIAAEVGGPDVIAQALAKVHAYGPLCGVTYDWMVRWLKENNGFVNVPAFLVGYLQHNSPALMRSLKASSPPVHPFNTHPNFMERMRALGTERMDPRLTISGPTAAALFPELETFEERLTELRTLEIMKTRPGHFFTRRKQPPYEMMTID